MIRLFLVGFIIASIAGCSFTSFDENRSKTTYKRVITPSGIQQNKELPMGAIGFGSSPNKSDFVKIEVKDQHVIGPVPSGSLVVKPKKNEQIHSEAPDTNNQIGEEAESCSIRNGEICKEYKLFPLYQSLEDVPTNKIGDIMTCRVDGLESAIFSCKEDQAECFSAKLGDYCIQEE